MKDKGIRVCIPGRKNRKNKVRHDRRHYKRRNRIGIMFEGQVSAGLVDIGGFLGIGERQVAVQMSAPRIVGNDATADRP